MIDGAVVVVGVVVNVMVTVMKVVEPRCQNVEVHRAESESNGICWRCGHVEKYVFVEVDYNGGGYRTGDLGVDCYHSAVVDVYAD